MMWWLGAAVLAWILCWFVRPLLRRAGVIDQPNARSSHAVATIRGGGVAIVASWLLCASVAWPQILRNPTLAWLLGLGLVLAVISFVDDVRPVPAFVRLAVHAMLAMAGLAVLGLASLPIPAVVLACLWVCGYTNAFNFMDGINGLASLQAVITGAGTALIGIRAGVQADHPAVWLALVISGSAAGFLPHNFPKARMFMGDVSSAVLGFLLAVVALWIARDNGWGLLLPLGLLHANFVLDTGITLVRRILGGGSWYEAHREHFYQRLVRAGWSHMQVTLLEMGLQLAVLAIALRSVGADLGLSVVAAIAVLSLWLSYFVVAERAFLRARASGPRGV